MKISRREAMKFFAGTIPAYYVSSALSLAAGANAPSTAPSTAPAASTGLKDAFANKFLIGTATDPGGLSDAMLANIKANYNVITPENCMKPQPIHPSEDTYNWTAPDTLVQWCQENNIKVYGHTLAWHSQTAPWFFQGVDDQPLTRELAMERLKKHILTVVGRYKGKIIGWDVVNEALNDGGNGQTENLRNSPWIKAIGPDYLTMAFKWAHEADPECQLYYNDYSNEGGAVENTGKHASSMILLKRLIADGAPINGVGIQGHWSMNPNYANVEKAITNYAGLGLKVSISEMDIAVSGANSGAMPTRGGGGDGTVSTDAFDRQAQVYARLFDIFNRHSDVISRVTFWGISDTRSWRRGQNPLLFDGQMNPKPAYKAVIDVAQGKYVAPQQ
jgi:endo-1,4-beta-xylanase